MARNSQSSQLLTRLGGLMAAKGIRAWMSTMEYHGLFYDRSNDAMYCREQKRIYIFWHEYILIPLFLRGNCNLAMLLSQHRDAEILARVADHLGFDCVRGSTSRGSTAALMDLRRRGRHQHLTITPDGPRGPRRKMAIGPIYLASRIGLPIVPMGFGIDRPWRANSWDRFAVPRPFSQVRGIVGPEIHVPENANRHELEHYRQGMENLLNDLTAESESWAESRERREGEFALRPSPRQLRREHLVCTVPQSVPELVAEETPAPLKLSA